ncbi:nucleotide modification associated domain-containing protein [Priestia aryabhattai]|uniref:nucleotide modification associated domain-containing protein n=1 Tax=Priestia aryabhattai TaxID=412384 RepID=UPI003531C294
MKEFKFKVGDVVRVKNVRRDAEDHYGKVAKVIEVAEALDCKYSLENIEEMPFYEDELELAEKVSKFELRESVVILAGEFTGTVGEIEALDSKYKKYVVSLGGGITRVYAESELEPFQEHDVTSANTDHQLHKDIITEIHDTYLKKNADYGNSFGDQYSEYGLLSALIRLDDKMRRLKQLTKQEAQVKDESIEDTLLDLSNYCIMTIMELRKEKHDQ